MPSVSNSSTVADTALVSFRPSAIHGIGGFAKADIAAGTRIIEYIGETITKAESLHRCESNNEYIFSLDDTHDLDGNVPGNPARFLNHSCDPNCEAEPDGGRVWIVAGAASGPGRKSRSTTVTSSRIIGNIPAAAARTDAQVILWLKNSSTT
jgi:SET domain-containing protein